MDNPGQANWNSRILSASALFNTLRAMRPFIEPLSHSWPSLQDYQDLLHHNVPNLCAYSGSPLHFVPQATKPDSFEDQYEARIYLKGEIQTRLKNWHDFFQVLVWCTFPKIKSTLNWLHYTESQTRRLNKFGDSNRGPLENSIALFDECGSIIISCDKRLLKLIMEFQWKNLFCKHRQQVEKHLRCFVFGHALYEKSMNPYIGMTSPSILLLVEPSFFKEPLVIQLQIIDNRVTDLFKNRLQIRSPRDLHPFPILGMPGWYNGQQDESFYDNTNYFRTGRRKR